jgi:tartrate-resistant acid phosphatase type 5
VVGHYPIKSTCEHGGIKCLARLEQLLVKYNASAYFAGHDHNMQHIRIKYDQTKTMDYMISGASSRSDRSTKHMKDVPKGSLLYRDPRGFNPFSQIGFSHGGFVYVTLSKEDALFEYYNGKGVSKYHSSLKPRQFP